MKITRNRQIVRGNSRSLAHGLPVASVPVLDLEDFPEVLLGWESDAGLGAYALDAGVSSWVDRVGGEDLVQATSIERPYYIPGEYSSNG